MAIKAQSSTETELWGNVEIICPICQRREVINIPMRIIEKSKQLTSLLIPAGRICDHTVVPFIDKNLKVRAYQKLDVLLEDIEVKNENKIKLRAQDIDLIEIIMNIKPETFIYMLRCSFFKKSIIIVLDNKVNYLKDTLFDFLEFIFHNSFEIKILVKSKDEYKNLKKTYNDFLVIEGKNIIGKMKKTINITDLKIEEEFIRDFYREGDSIAAINNLKSKIRQTYDLSIKLYEFCKKQGLKKHLQTKKAIRYLEDTHFIKIKKTYFQLLLKIIEYYYNTNIVLIQDKLAKKIDNMWGF
jgi:hypothetical protein